jgi:hypothetical protein
MTSELPQARRLRLFADADVEMSLVIRCAIYGLACVSYFSFMLICTQWMQTPEGKLVDVLLRCAEDTAYWLPGFLLLAPLALHDLVKASGRMVSPVVRLQNEMQALIQHQSERPLEWHEGETWPQLTASFNQLRGEILTLRREVAEYESMLGAAATSQLDQLPTTAVLPPEVSLRVEPTADSAAG